MTGVETLIVYTAGLFTGAAITAVVGIGLTAINTKEERP